MGLADFLVDAGRGTPYARVGAAMGGNGGKTMQDAFIDDQLPALADQLHKAQTKEEILKVGQAMIASGLKAGMRPDGLQRIMEMTVGPALHGMPNEELNKLRDEYAGKPAVPGESRPQGTEGPLTPQGNFIDPKAATPDKPLDLNFMMKFGQAVGANPEQFNKMLETPATMVGHQLSNQKTQQAIDQENKAQEAIKGLPNIPGPEGQPSQQAVANINRPGITQFVDQRGKQEDPLLEERRNLLNAQATRDSALATRALQGPAGAGGSETTTDRAVDPAKQADAGRQIAQAAKERGMTKPEQIRKIADDFGYTITGDPKIDDTLLSAFGVSNPKLGGNYSLTPKDITKTTTKGAPGNQGGYSKKLSGSAPVEPTAPKRMKFDAKGNLVQ